MATVMRPGDATAASDRTDDGGREDLDLRDLEGRLQRRYPELDPAAVGRAVREAYRTFDGARVRTFIPLLVENRAVRTLRARRATV